MRISTGMLYTAGVSRLTEIQTGLLKTQQQISTGLRILTPADDPIGAATILDLSQGQSMNSQQAVNRQNAKTSLSVSEGILQSTTSLLQDVKTQAVNAGNGILSDADRNSIADNLQGRLTELLGQANTTDGTGDYIFGGFQVTSPPFAATPTGASYSGDQGQRLLQVSASRQLATNDSGDAVFQQIPASGIYGAAASTTNTGTGRASALTVTDATKLLNHDYDIKFTVAAGVTTYDVLDKTTNTTLSTGNAYTPALGISINGQQVAISGAPDNNDTFNIRQNQHQSVFTTISNLITALRAPNATAVEKSNLDNSLAVANTNIDNALDNVLKIRSSLGSRLNELDALDTTGDDRKQQITQSMSQIQDVDYNQAISDLTKQNTTLGAAQKSFITITSLSLFSLLP